MAAPGRRRRSIARVWAGAGALVATLALSACELPRFGAPDAASEEGATVGRLWSGFFVIAAAVVLLIWVLLAIVIVRYRRRGADDDDIPSQRAYNIPLEIFYTAVPVLIVAALFVYSVRTEQSVVPVSSEPAVEVEVIGFQWGWQFRYQAEGFTVDAPPGEKPQLVIPIDEPTNLELVAVDVNHSFWVPDFLSKRDLIPGVDNEITVTPTREGVYEGRCAEFCGLDHWRMSFTVRVVSAAAYDEWVAVQREAGGTASVTETGRSVVGGPDDLDPDDLDPDDLDPNDLDPDDLDPNGRAPGE
ncbi:cytochrome c oxidase subunit II [soil metagenome]